MRFQRLLRKDEPQAPGRYSAYISRANTLANLLVSRGRGVEVRGRGDSVSGASTRSALSAPPSSQVGAGLAWVAEGEEASSSSPSSPSPAGLVNSMANLAVLERNGAYAEATCSGAAGEEGDGAGGTRALSLVNRAHRVPRREYEGLLHDLCMLDVQLAAVPGGGKAGAMAGHAIASAWLSIHRHLHPVPGTEGRRDVPLDREGPASEGEADAAIRAYFEALATRTRHVFAPCDLKWAPGGEGFGW